MLLNGDISPIHKMKTAGVAKTWPEERVDEGKVEFDLLVIDPVLSHPLL
jgi:hypothetical protein